MTIRNISNVFSSGVIGQTFGGEVAPVERASTVPASDFVNGSDELAALPVSSAC